MTGRNTPKRNRLGTLGAVVVALAALLQPAPLAAVSYEFDLTYDPATAVVAGTQVISFSRSEFGDEAVLLLLNNAGAVPNPHENPLLEDLRYQSGFEPGYTRITSIVDGLGAAVPFEEFTPPAHGRLFTYPIPGLAVRLRLPPRDHYRLTVAFRTRLPALRTGDFTSRDGVFVQRFAWYPRLYPHPDRYTLPPLEGYRVRIVVPPGYRVISHDERAAPAANGSAYVIESRMPAATIPLTIFPEDRFQLVEDASAHAAVRVFHRPGRERQARKLARYAAEALDHYAAFLGPLDYRRITIVEGVRPGAWGMAADAFVMLGSGGFNADVPFREIWNRVLEFLVAHEIGHFYFGVGTAVDFISDNWLSESLAQYVTLDYLEGKYGTHDNLFPDDAGPAAGAVAGGLLNYGSFRERLVTRFHALRKAGFDFPVASDVDAQNRNGLPAVIYDKGALAVRQLATEMGKDAFDEALAEYARRYRHRFTDTGQFLAHLEAHRAGMRSAGEQVLTTNRYPDYAVAGVAYEGNVARITIRDHGDSGLTAPVRVVVEGDGDGEKTLDFTVRGTEVLSVAGRVRRVEIDPAWYTLDVDRKNNHHPRRLNWVFRQHSRHEADLVGLDLRLFELSADALRLGGGVGYRSTGMVSYELSAGGAARIDPVTPVRWLTNPPVVQPGAYAAAELSLPRGAHAGALVTWYGAEDWSGSVELRRPLRTPVEVGTRPTLYDSGLSLATGLNVDQRPALEPWIALESVRLQGAVPHFASLRQRFTALPRAGTWSLQSSLAAAVPLRIVPRAYLVPGVDLGADWRLFGIGTAPPEGVQSRLRASGASEAGGQPATGRAYGGLDLLVPLVGGREDRILDLVVFRSLTATLYFEAENRFTAFPALGDGREWSPHAGIELSAGITSMIDLPLAIAGGIDVPLRTASDPSTWRVFLSANLPLRLYTLLLAD